jgi:glycoside/pentoside/hexuronide:cation symporter, GPH family
LRYIFGNVGAGISFVLAYGVFLHSTPEHPFGQLNRAGYAPFGATIAGVILVTILLSARGTHHVIPQLYVPRRQIGGVVPGLRAIKQTLRSRNFAVIAAAGLLHGINLGVHGGLAIYFSTYFWHLSAGKILWLGLLSGPAHPLAAISAPLLAKRWGKRDACVGLFLAAVILGNLPFVVALLGWMPAAGTAAQFVILLADLSVVGFIGTSGFVIVTSMVADIVEETELRTGRRSEGLLLAADTFLQKLSAGMAVAVPGLLLALVAFPPHADPSTLNPQVMRQLAFVSLPLWVALSLAATGILLFYRIDRQTHEANLTLLQPRRANPAIGGSPRLDARRE